MNAAITIIIIGMLFFLLTCWALIDITRRDFGGIEKKAAWGFLTMVPFIGPAIYFAIGIRKGRKKPPENTPRG
jgi:uncharacterized membrane protein YhaH (DUF805 family)